MDELALRKKIIATAIEMNARGLNRGKSGNVSARFDDGFLVTPTGMAYESTQPVDIVAMTQDGTARGLRLPSSEWRFHRDIYAARREVGAIVHAHSPFATSIACLGRDIPPFHYLIAHSGGRRDGVVSAVSAQPQAGRSVPGGFLRHSRSARIRQPIVFPLLREGRRNRHRWRR